MGELDWTYLRVDDLLSSVFEGMVEVDKKRWGGGREGKKGGEGREIKESHTKKEHHMMMI